MSYRELVQKCIRNDRGAQKALYDQFAPKMMAVAARYCQSVVEAEDVLQEAFVKVFKKISSLSDDNKLEGWIKRIVVNTALNQNRSKLYLFPMTEVKDDTVVATGELNITDMHYTELIQKIQSLPDGCRVIFNLYAIEGFSHKEIAQKLEISEGTSKSQYSRARQLLQEMISESQKIGYGAV